MWSALLSSDLSLAAQVCIYSQELDDGNAPSLAHDDAERAADQAKRFERSLTERMVDFFAEEAREEVASARAARHARREQGDLSSLRMANVEFVKALDNALRMGCGFGLSRWLPVPEPLEHRFAF